MDQQTPQQIPSEIRAFLENLLQEAEIVTVDDKMKEEMISELFYQLDQFLTRVIVDNLQPEDLEAFIKMNEEKKPKEDIEAFMKEKLPNAETLFANAFVEFKNLYLQSIQPLVDQNSSNNPQT